MEADLAFALNAQMILRECLAKMYCNMLQWVILEQWKRGGERMNHARILHCFKLGDAFDLEV